MSSYALNPIEVDVLNWMRGKYDDPILNLQIDALTVKNREYTKVGFFIDLLIPESIVLLGNEVNKFDNWLQSKNVEIFYLRNVMLRKQGCGDTPATARMADNI